MKKAITLILVSVLLMVSVGAGASDGTFYEDVWVLCQPNSFVNIRSRPSGRSPEAGRADCGDCFETDGREKNGFIHVYASIEGGEGWISIGYIVWQKPEYVGKRMRISSTGRVNARKTVNGKRRCWLRDGDEVIVYWLAEWAVTNKGFVKAEYLGSVNR